MSNAASPGYHSRSVNPGADALTINWAALRFQHTATIRSRLIEMYSAATVKKILSALRGCLKAAWRLGQMNAEDYQRAIDLDRINGSTLPAGRALTAGEIAALLEACAKDSKAAGVRDGAMIAVLRACGGPNCEAWTWTTTTQDTFDVKKIAEAGPKI